MQLSVYTLLQYSTLYLFLINIVAIAAMWWDKRKARQGEWRVAEASLLILCFIGGAFGLFIGMYTFHHKTKKRLFQVIACIGFIASIAIMWTIWTQLSV